MKNELLDRGIKLASGEIIKEKINLVAGAAIRVNGMGDNIDYDILILDNGMEKERIDEIVDIMLETVYTARKSVRIAGDDYPRRACKG